MIHDIILSLLNPCARNLPIEEFLLSDSVSSFLHPAENEILEKIFDIVKIHREIVRFTQFYRLNYETPSVQRNTLAITLDENLQKSLYLQAFANGIDLILEHYVNEVSDLEKSYLKTPTHSLLFIYHKINVFQPILTHIQKLIRHVRSHQKLHTCALLKYLHKNKLHGNKEIFKGMILIQTCVNVVFLKHLTHWLLYAKIIDNYGEFFIQYSANECTNKISLKTSSFNDSSKLATNSVSDGFSQCLNGFEEIWHYDIVYDYLPHFLSPTVAEKILFIGQTVLMFKVDANQKKIQQWSNYENLSIKDCSIWNNKESVFFHKIQDLQNLNSLNSLNFELLIDEIKSHVTERLSQIAVNQADLIKQLKLIKNYYLLGRGELYSEFIKKIYELSDKSNPYSCKENTIRDIIKAYELSAAGVGVTEELEQLTMTIHKDAAILNESKNVEAYMNYVTLQYQIKWPLQLLFSPKVIQRYNDLFCFLLHIKRLQYDLHYTWHLMRRNMNLNETVLQLRQQFIFVIDNIQSYIQADVLENQFNHLMAIVINSNDFEQIQRAHSVFQANILALCFLLGSDITSEDCISSITIPMDNPILRILNEIFYLCDEFCNLIRIAEYNSFSNIQLKFEKLNMQLPINVEQLINLLFNLKSAPTSTSLSQLLLRLDFNHWFSNHGQNKSTSD